MGMEEPTADEMKRQLLGSVARFRKNACAFLIAVARYVEVCEAREARRTRTNPWIIGQVVEN